MGVTRVNNTGLVLFNQVFKEERNGNRSLRLLCFSPNCSEMFVSLEVAEGNIPLMHHEVEAAAQKVSFIKQNCITCGTPKV